MFVIGTWTPRSRITCSRTPAATASTWAAGTAALKFLSRTREAGWTTTPKCYSPQTVAGFTTTSSRSMRQSTHLRGFRRPIHGNVQMFGPDRHTEPAAAGNFSSKTHGTGWDYEGNIICSNSAARADLRPERAVLGHPRPQEHRAALHRRRRRPELRAAHARRRRGDELERPVRPCGQPQHGRDRAQHRDAGHRLHARRSITIPPPTSPRASTTSGRWKGSRRTGPTAAASRSAPTSGSRDVIVNGAYPKIGPAAAAWKAWYDPKNQITS